MHEFKVINLTTSNLAPGSIVRWNKRVPLLGTVVDTEFQDVSGLAPFVLSTSKVIRPSTGFNDDWGFWENGVVKNREFQLNVRTTDRYVLVTISDYGFGVIVTHTSPDTWQW